MLLVIGGAGGIGGFDLVFFFPSSSPPNIQTATIKKIKTKSNDFFTITS
jgi:hypothetical protein